MKRSYIIAGVLAIVAVGWIASGQFADGGNQPEALKPPADLSGANRMPLVRVRSQSAQTRTAEIMLRGRTEAFRTVEVKAEIHGKIIDLTIERGDDVETGQVIATLSPEDRPAKLKEAEARLAQRRIEFEASHRLSKKGFRAETALAADKAALEAAQAAVEQARVDFKNTLILAPFKGLIDERMIEIGDFVEQGDQIARVVDLDPILVVAQVNERDVGRLKVGAEGRARLVTGDRVNGRLRFVASMADSVTRTFRVELEVANPQGTIPDGITAELAVPLDETKAHLVSPAILTLTDEGVVGIKTLEADSTVGFYAVKILESGSQGVWVTGLPDQVTLVTVGQEFISIGQKVRAVDEGSLEPRAGGDGTS